VSTERENRIASLLSAASSAHHSYEQEELGGEFHPDWPQWYAAWLLENGLASTFTPPPGQQALADALERISAEHKEADSEQAWADFTASRLLAAF
jgi:hypothetical protein